MEKLQLKQQENKLIGGFSVLSTNKLKSINGGEISNGICTNREDLACNVKNSENCQNYSGNHCKDSTNSNRCQNY